MQHLFLSPRFFAVLIGLALLSALGGWITVLGAIAALFLVFLVLALLIDAALLWWPKQVVLAKRVVSHPLSLDDEQTVTLLIESRYRIPLRVEVMDELPEQLQLRNQQQRFALAPKLTFAFDYTILPKVRGAYQWGQTVVVTKTKLGLVQRRFMAGAAEVVPVYPSVLQMKRLSFLGLRRQQTDAGERNTFRLGQSYEFDRIKNYVQGDDVRHINWRATARRNELMLNQYVDERAQNIICALDKSRAMNFPFNGLSLLDYAVNASLALCNVALQRGDKAGLMSFSDNMGTVVRPDNAPRQLQLLLEALYNEQSFVGESNFELLHRYGSRILRNRSLLLLFTNFETVSALERALPMLKLVRQNHALVVVLFINTEIEKVLDDPTERVSDIYFKVTAQEFLQQKQTIAQMLHRLGIHTILCRPEELSVRVINKYVDLKSKFVI